MPQMNYGGMENTIGLEYPIRINPKNPKEFLDPTISYKTQYITGGIYIVGSMAILLNMIF